MLSLFQSVNKASVLTSSRIIWNKQFYDKKSEIPSSNTVLSISRCASVYVVADKNSPTLPRTRQWERSASLMRILLRHKRHNTHCDFNLVREATELLDQCDMLNESNARLLISSCGKTMSFFNEEKSRQAQQVFKLAKNKTISLANELLRVQLENSMFSDPQQVLKRLDELQLVPNEDTAMQLIATACLSGDIITAKDILNVCNEYELEVSSCIYGHFAYSFGKAGNTDIASQLIDQLLIHHKQVSWDVFSLFIRGIAKNDIVLEEVLNKYHSHLEHDLTMSQFLDICKEFWQHSKTFDSDLITKYFSSNPRISDIIHASNHLSKFPYSLSAPCLKFLMSKCRGYLNLNNLVRSLNVLVKHSVESKNFDEIWNTLLLLEKFNNHDTETAAAFLTLSILIQKDCYSEQFYEKLCKKGIEFELPIPFYLKRQLGTLRINVAEVETFLEKQHGESDANKFQEAVLS